MGRQRVKYLIQRDAHTGEGRVDVGAVGRDRQRKNDTVRQGGGLGRVGAACDAGRQVGAVKPGSDDLIPIRRQQPRQICRAEIAANHGKGFYVPH